MLTALSIRNIVLIDKLDLAFGPGLSVLTGETGAGKSILLDAFALALGGRGDASLVRTGESHGQVTAVFEPDPGHPVRALLGESGVTAEGALIFRRSQSPDGRTKAFINDEPVSVQLLRRAGAALVEIHGQHDDRALMDSGLHRQLLDAYGGLLDEAEAVRELWNRWRAAEAALAEKARAVEESRVNAEFLRHALDELEAIDPQPDEEEALADRRQMMMNASKISGDLDDALSALAGHQGVETRLSGAMRRLDRHRGAGSQLEAVIAALERVLIEAAEGRRAVAEFIRASQFSPDALERAEERLFRIRATARKHRVAPSHLPALMEKFRASLEAADAGEDALNALRREARAAREGYAAAAQALSDRRREASARLDAAVEAELAPLKLEKARFITQTEQRANGDGDMAGGPYGFDDVAFHVQTNPGAMPGPLMKIASGGELSRFMLALKAALAEKGSAPTLIFDEIDSGAGGAVAAAIGERLARLGDRVQVLAITHAPQVAAHASGHLRIAKHSQDEGGEERMVTRVTRLDPESRREEIARMLAGAVVTDEARAAAEKLLGGKN
jgi:DNA repair protein RecN (Recombination protein N)